jgi:hypothetical protein
MFVLVTYDVSTVEAAGRRRLRRVARACSDYGGAYRNLSSNAGLDRLSGHSYGIVC